MIKLIIFDMDGVLIDAKDLHYEALNLAIEKYAPGLGISRDEHVSIYDGMTTNSKLKLLTKNKGLNSNLYDLIWNEKQKETRILVNTEFVYDDRIRSILKQLSDAGYTLAVASNSIRKTVSQMLFKKGFIEYIDFIFSNDDVKFPKPNSEIYLKCMISAGVSPNETIIIEDSPIGIKGAVNSGAFVLQVKNSEDLTLKKINNFIDDDKLKKSSIKWKSDNLNILVPMAGAGSRFAEVGYVFPKPLIEVNGKPMIQLVVDNINIEAHYIFIVQKLHYDKYNLKYLLNLIAPNCDIIQVDGLTEGAACTTLLAKNLINNDTPLIITNSDQMVDWDSTLFMYSMTEGNIDGGIVTFSSIHPKWSYAKLNEFGFVDEVAEKKPISNMATAGIYFWKSGEDYVRYAEEMISKNIRVNNEFYVCPVFNMAIADQKKIKTFNCDKMWGLGTPEDLNYYLNNCDK